MKEEVRHAAWKAVGGFICIGRCHADCAFQGRNMGLKMSVRRKDQGFMTSKGRFVDRVNAAYIAKRADQVDKRGKRKIIELLSEDIWYRKDMMYCFMRGYVKISSVVVD